ncbi:MAG: DUF1838 family protein [Gammaproteobacteria bacterium]|nr:DUF1838 family protein [Gammaproteobacteria bacterium]MDE0412974.1 DUF1838 family protein [Gammaproteobacteria bacterium]
MRSLIRNCAPVMAGLLLAGMAHASASLDTAEGRLAAYRKMQCSLIDGKESFFWWTGTAYGHVAGQPDIRLFRVEGINVRRCASVPDDERGDGFRLISREILVYQDIETGEMLHTWENPYTGETVEVLHVANDPVNQPAQHPLRRDGSEYPLPLVTQGNDWWWSAAVPLFYPNPLGGDYQKYVGGTYHATEMFNFKGKLDDLLDADSDTATLFVGWVRLAQWLPWMEMGSRSGKMYFHAGGKKVGDYENVPADFRAVIEEHFPLYLHAPPMDDDRPNETSWTYFRKVMEAREDQGVNTP